MLNALKDIKKQDLAHSIMLVSQDEFALKESSVYLAKLLLCKEEKPCNTCTICKKIDHKNHADVMTFPEEKESIAVEEMLKIVDSVLLSPYEADKKIYILNNVSGINNLAQNKLLKTLEEPPKNVYFILNVTSEAKVLPTIKSRCRKIYLETFDDNKILESLIETNLSVPQKEMIVAYSNGSIQNALNFASKENFFGILDFVFDLWENMKHSSQMLKYASKLFLLKNDFKLFLFLYNTILEEILYVKLNKYELVKNKSKLDWYEKVAEEFSGLALANIAKYLIVVNEKLERNCNQNIMIDNFLMTILEEKVKCR